jgi:hypothetical protein
VKAVCVKKFSSGIHPWVCLSGLTVDTSHIRIRNIEKCHVNVKNVGKSLLLPDSLKGMKELTLVRHILYVSTVEKPSFVGVAFTNIVNNVGKSSYT